MRRWMALFLAGAERFLIAARLAALATFLREAATTAGGYDRAVLLQATLPDVLLTVSAGTLLLQILLAASRRGWLLCGLFSLSLIVQAALFIAAKGLHPELLFPIGIAATICLILWDLEILLWPFLAKRRKAKEGKAKEPA